MEACAAVGLEGVIMKRKGSLYRPGYRGPDWIKVPIHHTEEFIVMGYLAASPDRLSSLILAHYDQHAKIAYAGLVGTGLSEEARGMLLAQLHALKRKTCPALPPPCCATTLGSCEPICHPNASSRCSSCRWSIGSAPGKDCVTLRSRGLRPDQTPRRVVQSTLL